MRRVVVTTGTRAEYGILRPVLHAISTNKKFELFLIVTGSHLSKKYGLTINEIKKDGLRIFAKVDMIPKENTAYSMSKSVGEGIIKFSKIFKRIKPHINLVLGDRDEMLASAIAAYHMNIPNAHIHGGDKSGGIDEYNRHAITKISNIHFAATKESRDRIIRMGENPKYVFLTGSPSIDEVMSNKITNKKDLELEYGIRFTGNEILLLYHPVTTDLDKSEKEVRNILKVIIKIKHTTITIFPNSDAGSNKIRGYLKSYSNKYKFIRTYITVPRNDYLGMLKNCGVLVGNSSSGMIEASYFNTPIVNIGDRQKGRERGRNVIDVKSGSPSSIYVAIQTALKRKSSGKSIVDYAYGRGNAAEMIVKYLEKIPLGKELIQKELHY
ncbi:MAG: UDP-N-acetylglucosamine 2-epimerase (hydrolyzing) [Patescibacteria group bacterium]|nr:UDP-N-acetylglucosamine 2-epimerase (hydrolyzing) [Patescibacteria group bacterium]